MRQELFKMLELRKQEMIQIRRYLIDEDALLVATKSVSQVVCSYLQCQEVSNYESDKNKEDI